jgi:peptide-methionine (R)-S-oxide reductase
MTRRTILSALAGLGLGGAATTDAKNETKKPKRADRIELSEAEWRKRLTPEQFNVLRKAGTERAFTSPLNDEKRKGTFHCVACDLALFGSDMKYDSGTGWPSFFKTLPEAFETTTDYLLIYPRTEYHCARCGGHHGHDLDDGPQPTGKRWRNNGVALKFVPTQA